MITEINKETAKQIRSLAEAHLTTMLEDNGLTVSWGMESQISDPHHDDVSVTFTSVRFSLLNAMDPEEEAV